jgi:hypothetical protein
MRSRLEPVKEVAAMLKRRFDNIITYLHQRDLLPLWRPGSGPGSH